MSRIAQRSLTTLVVAAALLLGAPATIAASGVGGSYTASVVLGPLLLDGRYPFAVGESTPGTIDVTTSPTGALSARVTFAAQTEDAVGRISVRRNGIRLQLRGKVDEGRISVTAVLRGSAFVGTVKLRGTTSDCRMEVGSAGPLRAQYQLALTSASNGGVTGTGTVTVGRETLPVTARGNARKQGVSLQVSGGKTTLRFDRGATAADSATVTAPTWKARGFGASAQAGRPLRLVPN